MGGAHCLVDGAQDASEGHSVGAGVLVDGVDLHACADGDKEDGDEAHQVAHQPLPDWDLLAQPPAGQQVEERGEPKGGWPNAEGGDQSLEVAEEWNGVRDHPTQENARDGDDEPSLRRLSVGAPSRERQTGVGRRGMPEEA